MTKDEDVRQSELFYQECKDSNRSTWSLNVANDRAFVANVQWISSDASALDAANQPAITSNETTPARDQVVSSLTKNSPRWMSYGKEKSDINVATKLADLMEHIWYKSDGDTRNRMATEDFIDTGMWCMMAYVDNYADYGKGEVCITDLDPLTVYIDPTSKRSDTEDAAYKMIVIRATKEYIENKYSDFDFKDAMQSYDDDIPTSSYQPQEGQVLKVTDETRREYYLIIDRYSKIKSSRFHIDEQGVERLFDQKERDEYWEKPAIILTRTGQEEYVTDDDQVIFWQDILRRYGNTVHYMSYPEVTPNGQINDRLEIMKGVEHPGSIPNSTTNITEINKGYLINLGVIKMDEVKIDRIKRVFSIGGKLYYKDILPISRYPIVTEMNHHQRNPFPLGDIRYIRPLQEQLNKITSKITAYISAISNLLAFVPKGSGIKNQMKETAGEAGMKIYEVDFETDGGGVAFGQYPPLPAGVFEDRQRIIAQIQRIMGAYPFMDGDTSQAPETYRATLVIQEEGQNRAQYKRKKIESGINTLAKVVAELIPHVYTQEKIVRLLKPNHQMRETVFNQTSYETGAKEIINDLSTIEADIMMVSGSMLPTNRWARSEYYTGLYEKGILPDRSVILRESEIEDVEEIIAKFDREQQLQQYVQQLEEQLKMMGGQLQSKSREVISANEKVEVEKLKTRLKSYETDIKGATLLGKQRINDEVKRRKNDTTRTK